MAAPDGSVMVPARPEVPADCAIKDGTQIANNRVKSAINASCETPSSVLDLDSPFSFSILYVECVTATRALRYGALAVSL